MKANLNDMNVSKCGGNNFSFMGHMGSHSVGSGDFPAFTPTEACTQFSDPGGMQG